MTHPEFRDHAPTATEPSAGELALEDRSALRRVAAVPGVRIAREVLRPALEGFGLRIDDSEAGLYLWASAGEPSRVTVDRLAQRGILVAPGDFYGVAGEQHVRVAVTASDERIAAAAARLADGPAW